MTSARDAFLQRVRQAVAEGNRAGHAAPPGPRGSVGYQGGGPDLAARFCEQLAAAGGHPHPVAGAETATREVLALAEARGARRVLLGRGAFLDSLALGPRLQATGMEVVPADHLTPDGWRDSAFAADLAITGVDYLIAETGTVGLLSAPGSPRCPSLLPPVHIAVAERRQLLPDLFDLFAPLARSDLPSCLTLITGPSKTGDIELRLVTGVHGPGELHVILVEG
jgi:L-lactate dehydrogenase complex protein LldG